MTTTSTFQGISDEAKPSSKVIRPPGGGSSGIFGIPYDEDRDFKMSDKKRQEKLAAQANQPAAAAAASQPEASPIQHAKAPQTDTQANLFGGSAAPTGSKAKAQGEEFPVYDASVYAAQMTPQRRNITQARFSTHNPITGEAYAGFEDCDDSPQAKSGKRQKNLGIESSPEAYNPITGAPIGGAGNGDGGNQTRNSSKVINPPGGKSSGLW